MTASTNPQIPTPEDPAAPVDPDSLPIDPDPDTALPANEASDAAEASDEARTSVLHPLVE
jgi:hypothetical protein